MVSRTASQLDGCGFRVRGLHDSAVIYARKTKHLVIPLAASSRIPRGLQGKRYVADDDSELLFGDRSHPNAIEIHSSVRNDSR